MNDEEIMSIKFIKLIYRRGNQIIQTFCKIDSPPESRSPPPLICKNLDTLREVPLNHDECIEVWLMTKNLGP